MDKQTGILKHRADAFDQVDVCKVTDNPYNWVVEQALSTSATDLRLYAMFIDKESDRQVAEMADDD